MENVEEKEIYQFLECLKRMGINSPLDMLRFTEMAYDCSDEDLKKMILRFSDDYDKLREEYRLTNPMPRDKWMDIQRRIHGKQTMFDWLFLNNEDLSLKKIEQMYEVSNDRAREIVRDFVFGFEFMEERILLDVVDVERFDDDEFE